MSSFPMSKADSRRCRAIVESLAAKQREAGADVIAWERQIDQLVYALYGLTPEGIQLVEGAAK
jgi:hypothetical protein